MSDLGQQIFSSLAGNYSLEAKLQSIRGKLSEINTAVRKLESNMIFLLVNPGLVNYTSSETSNSSEQESVWNTGEDHSAVVSTPKTDYGQEEFMTNPIQLHDELSQNMGVRHALMVSEDEIVDAIDAQKKKMHYDNINSMIDKNNAVEHPNF